MDTDLPPGLYVAGEKFRARSWGPDRLPKYAKDLKPTWKTFRGPLQDAAREFYAWKGQRRTRDDIHAACERYILRELPKLAPSTQRTELPRIRRLQRVFGHMRPRDVRKKHLYEYIEAAPRIGGKKDVKRLGAMYLYWIRWELCETNPVDGLQFVSDRARERYVTDDELHRALSIALYRAFSGWHSASIVYAVLRLEELTGRRESDLLRLQLTDMTDDGLLFREGKTGKRALIPWTTELSAAAEEVKRINRPEKGRSTMTLICNADGGKVSEGSFNQAWQRLRPDLIAWIETFGPDPFQPRDIRAKYATDSEAMGRDASVELQHASRTTTRKHYVRKPAKVRSLR